MTTSTDYAIQKIESLADNCERLRSLLNEALPLVAHAPTGRDLATRIANELARQMAGSA
jgi:hypothetical protein